MALKNLKNNFSFYALYLLSVSFVITVFFAFTSFSMNKVMLEKISGNGRVETMCNVISISKDFTPLNGGFIPFSRKIRNICRYNEQKNK